MLFFTSALFSPVADYYSVQFFPSVLLKKKKEKKRQNISNIDSAIFPCHPIWSIVKRKTIGLRKKNSNAEVWVNQLMIVTKKAFLPVSERKMSIINNLICLYKNGWQGYHNL